MFEIFFLRVTFINCFKGHRFDLKIKILDLFVSDAKKVLLDGAFGYLSL